MTESHLGYAAPAGVNVLPMAHKSELDNLPPPNTTRWVARRKGQVINAVRRGLLSVGDACNRYGISEEEYHSWEKLFDRHGTRALRVTRLKDYRRKYLQDGKPGDEGRVAS
ncbi:MAG: DUF1153 domain-containing protein [Alphaproteobacteria bacterium]|nr:DUF1153 domain-containing protein [Alphaproteobacteria bacterium]NDC56438.1 DUF1153 domain-containing protein [Alphaproteobacteria bacterium]NDG04862.1 DUF1153 domain-containing protein [Alphaproteobacteria bacterium]